MLLGWSAMQQSVKINEYEQYEKDGNVCVERI